MKRSEDFVKRVIFDDVFLVPIGEASKKISGLVSLNETCAFVYDCFSEDITADEIVKKVTERYDVDYDTAKNDVEECLEGFIEAGIIVY